MTTCEAVTRKWGNSIGIIIPKDLLEKEHIRENQEIIALIRKKKSVPMKSFGLIKGKLTKSAQQIKDELKKELYND